VLKKDSREGFKHELKLQKQNDGVVAADIQCKRHKPDFGEQEIHANDF
jgi:hypothetical protein